MNKHIRIGAVNWDAGLTGDTYFGHWMLNSLEHPDHRDRLPYFANKDENGNYFFPERTQKDYDEEIKMAYEAGIDFFMYVWYPDANEPREIGEELYPYLVEHIHELNTMRKLYQQSPMNKLIKMCAIIIAEEAYSRNDIKKLVLAMKEDYYEKKDGRPLVFIYGGYATEFFSEIREIAKREGLDPFIVFINNGRRRSENGDYSEADAVSAYAVCHGAEDYETLCRCADEDNEKRKEFGIPVIPILSAGWNPQPRIDRVVPWSVYTVRDYAPVPTGEQMEKAALDYFKWIEDNQAVANTGYGVVFAWNEFEEGGFLCPSLGPDGKPCADKLNGLKRAIKEKN